MAKPELLETLQNLAQPIVTSKGLEIWGIELLSGTRPLVRVYIESAHVDTGEEADTAQDMRALSASVDECAEISRMLGLAMDVEDIFTSDYILEVSTPGFSRLFFHLSQLRGYEGDTLEVSLMDFLKDCPAPLQGRKKIKGILKHVDVEAGTFTLSFGETGQVGDILLHWDTLRKVSRMHIFVTPEKPGKKRKNEK